MVLALRKLLAEVWAVLGMVNFARYHLVQNSPNQSKQTTLDQSKPIQTNADRSTPLQSDPTPSDMML